MRKRARSANKVVAACIFPHMISHAAPPSIGYRQWAGGQPPKAFFVSLKRLVSPKSIARGSPLVKFPLTPLLTPEGYQSQTLKINVLLCLIVTKKMDCQNG